MTNRYWIEFHNRKGNGALGSALGSEGTQPLDGRLALHSAINEGIRRAHNLRFVQPSYEAFRILRGAKASTAIACTRLIPINREDAR